MATEKKWEMNETQKAFVKELEGRENGVTLFELKLEGKVFKTGSINTLITKGVVVATDEKEFECAVMYNGVQVGKVTKTAKVYKLVK